jgi:hypothetical protein
MPKPSSTLSRRGPGTIRPPPRLNTWRYQVITAGAGLLLSFPGNPEAAVQRKRARWRRARRGQNAVLALLEMW